MAPKPNAISTETRRLGAYMAAALGRRLPAPVVEKAKLHILDTLAAMVSGSRLAPGKRAIAFVAGLGGRREAGVVGTPLVMSATDAAFANGMFAHADETDDSHLSAHIHPGAAIVPSALAAAEKTAAGGQAFLRAVVLGYDVGCRSTKALDVPGFSASQRAIHSFGGTFGAGAAAGALLGLDATQARHLLSYLAQSASGCGAYMHESLHIQKAFVYSGKTARDGVLAASLVAAGFAGVEDVFSGERNFLDAYAVKAHPEALADGLGRRYEIMGTNIKKWCVGSPIQAVLDSVEGLIRDHGIAAADVGEVVVRLAPGYARTVNDRPMPDVNVQHLTALFLVDGGLTFDSIHDAKRMKDRAVLALRRRLRLEPTEALAGVKPRRQAIVEITTADGCKLVRRTKRVRGTTDNPMTRDEVIAKAHDLIDGIIGKRRARRLVETIFRIEELKDMRRLRALLAASLPQ